MPFMLLIVYVASLLEDGQATAEYGTSDQCGTRKYQTQRMILYSSVHRVSSQFLSDTSTCFLFSVRPHIYSVKSRATP